MAAGGGGNADPEGDGGLGFGGGGNDPIGGGNVDRPGGWSGTSDTNKQSNNQGAPDVDGTPGVDNYLPDVDGTPDVEDVGVPTIKDTGTIEVNGSTGGDQTPAKGRPDPDGGGSGGGGDAGEGPRGRPYGPPHNNADPFDVGRSSLADPSLRQRLLLARLLGRRAFGYASGDDLGRAHSRGEPPTSPHSGPAPTSPSCGPYIFSAIANTMASSV